jgi:hypothetical protein
MCELRVIERDPPKSLVCRPLTGGNVWEFHTLISPPPQHQIEIGEHELAWNRLPFNRIVLL